MLIKKEDDTMAANYSDERRSFLKTVMLAGSAAACLPLATETKAAVITPRLPQEESGPGYRETEHISKYYKTARN